LGNCAEDAALKDSYPGGLPTLQERVGKLPQGFLERNAWLNDFRSFDFENLGPKEWSGIRPSAEEIAIHGEAYFPKVEDYKSLFSYFGRRLRCAVASARDRYPLVLLHQSSSKVIVPKDTTPTTITWDDRELQIFINGEPLDQYVATVIQPSGWDRNTFERNAWIYVKCLEGVPYATICSKMKSLCNQLNKMDRKWRVISDPQGIQTRAREFAKRLGLPELPRRQPGRPSHRASIISAPPR